MFMNFAAAHAGVSDPIHHPPLVRDAGHIDSAGKTTYPFQSISKVTCFASGTMIRGADYERPIDGLKIGDLVMTRDNGPQPIRWIGTTKINAIGVNAPVTIAAGALGNTDTLWVSPQHRMLLEGWRCATIAGTREVLTTAISLINGRDIIQTDMGQLTYFHLAFDQHEIITAAGIGSESYHPDAMPQDALKPASRAKLLQIFPVIAENPAQYGPIVRPEVKPYEASLIRP